MKLHLGMHMVMHLVFFGKTGVTTLSQIQNFVAFFTTLLVLALEQVCRGFGFFLTYHDIHRSTN
jgi:hypothetical protein